MYRYAILSLLLLGADVGAAPRAATGWQDDGIRSCTFDGAAAPIPCRAFFRHAAEAGAEYWLIWRGADGREVRYGSRVGIVGVSSFTIGTLVDRSSTLPGHMSNDAVSYAPDRERLIIGVPNDGYQFEVGPARDAR